MSIPPNFLAQMIPFLLFGLFFYGLVFYCVWKFYQMLSKINDNIAGINDHMNGIRRSGIKVSQPDAAQSDPPQPGIQLCPACGLKVLPAGRCPSCQAPL